MTALGARLLRSFVLTHSPRPDLIRASFLVGSEEDAPVGPGQGEGVGRVATKAGFRLSPE